MADYFKNVMLIGATGELGSHIFSALLDLPKTHPDQPVNLSVLTRTESKSTQNLPSHVTVHRGDLTSKDFLSQAFTGQDMIICAISPLVLESQHFLLDVAAEAGVRRFVLGEYGVDTLDEEMVPKAKIFQMNKAVQEHAAELVKKYEGKFSYSAIIPGVFVEMCMIDAELGFDFEARTAKIYDRGVKLMDATRMADVGIASAEMVFRPDRWVNEFAYISNFTISQSLVLEILNKVDKKGPWKVEEYPAQKLWDDAERKLKDGNVLGMVDEIWAVGFEDNKIGEAFSKSRELSNKDLGIPEIGAVSVEDTIQGILDDWESGRRKKTQW